MSNLSLAVKPGTGEVFPYWRLNRHGVFTEGRGVDEAGQGAIIETA